MTIQHTKIIGELVAEDYRTASVFKKHNIDFCCQGNRTIGEACEKQTLDTSSILKDLANLTLQEKQGDIDFKTWPADLLVDYIEKKHHRYVEEKSAEIKPYLDKVCKVHGNHHPELHEINALFSASTHDLAAHMKKEELILFPFVKKMEKIKRAEAEYSRPHFDTIENPIHMMNDEHLVEGERFRKIEALSNQYTPPADACNTYRVTFALLKEFEADLHLHIHLENNILFPKAIALEKHIRP